MTDNQINLFIFRHSFTSAQATDRPGRENKLFLIGNRYSVTCYETENYIRICLYQNQDNILEIYLYNQITQNDIMKIPLTPEIFDSDCLIFFKAIHFKKEIGVFMFYTKTSLTTPIISFKIFKNDKLENYNSFGTVNINKIDNFNSNITLNDLIKISDDKIGIASVSKDKSFLYLVILNFFDEDTKMMITYYKFNMAEIYLKIYLDIKLYLFNNFICLGFSHCKAPICGDSDTHHTSIILFNYPNKNDNNLNLIQFLNLNDNNIGNLCINLTNNIEIENDIFGYTIEGVKIIDIPEEINLYYKSNNTLILKDYVVTKKDEIKISSSADLSVTATYTIKYATVMKEPDISNYLGNEGEKYYLYMEESDLNQYYSPKEIIGKTFYYNIIVNNLLDDSLCNAEYCSLCESGNNNVCLICNNGYYYNSKKRKCIIKPVEEPKIPTTKITTSPSTEITTIDITTIFNNDTNNSKSNEVSDESHKTNNIDSTLFNETSSEEEKCSYNDITQNICNKIIDNEQIKQVYERIRKRIINGDLNIINNTIYKTKNSIFHITTLKEQENIQYPYISFINFDECEKIIKDKYKIEEEDELIIFKIDLYSNYSSEVYVQYEIYNPYNYSYIPLDICKKIRIKINIPINLNQDTLDLYISLNESGYNLFHSNDSFYNDVCATYTTENGTDITLLDRKRLIYDIKIKIFIYAKLVVNLNFIIILLKNQNVIVKFKIN